MRHAARKLRWPRAWTLTHVRVDNRQLARTGHTQSALQQGRISKHRACWVALLGCRGCGRAANGRRRGAKLWLWAGGKLFAAQRRARTRARILFTAAAAAAAAQRSAAAKSGGDPIRSRQSSCSSRPGLPQPRRSRGSSCSTWPAATTRRAGGERLSAAVCACGLGPLRIRPAGGRLAGCGLLVAGPAAAGAQSLSQGRSHVSRPWRPEAGAISPE